MNEITYQQKNVLEEFSKDSNIIGEETVKFLNLVYPSYLVDKDKIGDMLDEGSTEMLCSMTFFRISSCSAENADNVFEKVNEKFEKLITALHPINVPIAYGIVARDGVTNLVLGISSGKNNVESVKTITQGMLSGIDMKEIKPDFSNDADKAGKSLHYGILAGVPSLYVKEQKQTFSLASVMRSLNGQNYTLLFIAEPVSQDIVSQNISQLISVRDKAFSVSKRNVARSHSSSHSETENKGTSDGKNSVAGQNGGAGGTAVGTAIGTIVGTIVMPGIGTIVGGTVGAAVGGGLGTIIGNVVGRGKTHSETYSKSISDTITNGDTISGDIQNGFALELMNYADSAIERLKGGQNNGIWQTAITYSAESENSRNIIMACLKGELSKLDAKNLPMLAFEPEGLSGALAIPRFLNGSDQNPLCSYINSAELGLLCTVPTESVPDFELRLEKQFPLVASRGAANQFQIGNVVDGKRPLENMPFGLSEQDLNKHTLVCGITGSGKTTTVKKILIEAKKPFLVIESAKKEYRSIAVENEVYTPGKMEIHAPQINPFYIMPGVSPQVHIDYLKDLFNASFSFYGPMPYILEKCLHSVYKNKGWDLTFGYHPLLSQINKPTDFLSKKYTEEQCSIFSHKLLFPTMQELKDEIARYIDEELKYDGEVAGNVKTAMKVRLENLCVGAKGYTFNTSEFFNSNFDFGELLKKNVVFELEGFADDSDKAFSVGLLVIFINEYRQANSGSQETGLQHLLVIEEAHRLLKNVETERLTENFGNAKGKAVEHFTNMIAEMRSYGQGVIVAEQIPTKLAPDVIKNSSNKIVQRIVSADDQQTIANTIGITGDDAIQLGSLETGFAYCHKEGMTLPTLVKIRDYSVKGKGKKPLDVIVNDELLYKKYNNNDNDIFHDVNLSIVRSFFGGNILIKQKIVAFLNTLMVEDCERCAAACQNFMNFVKSEIGRNGIRLTLISDSDHLESLIADFLTEQILAMMVRGVYCAKELPGNEFKESLKNALYIPPTCEEIEKIRSALSGLYAVKDLAIYAKDNVTAFVNRSMKSNTDVPNTVREYFIGASDDTVSEIVEKLKGGKISQ